VIALAAALALAPLFTAAFWDRDLGALAREVAEHPGAAEAGLFQDLLRLCDCDALPALEAPDPLRSLVRIEAIRGLRLGGRASTTDTVWRDLLRKDFFHRDPKNPSLANALTWPDEAEAAWSREVRLVDPPRWRCDKPARPPAAQDDAALADALRVAGYAEAASRFAYHRATRLLAFGEKPLALEQARAVDPAALGELGRWAALLRIHLEIDGREAAVELARGWRGPDSLAARALAADHLARQGRWAEIPDIAQAAEGTAQGMAQGMDRALVEHVELLRVRALLELGRRDEALAEIPRAGRSDLIRDLALEALATRPLDSSSADLVRSLWPDPGEAFARLAQRALFAGALDVARSAAAALDRFDPRGILIQAELTFAAGDRKAFAASVARIGTAGAQRGAARLASGRAALELASALATLAPVAPALRLDAAVALESLADRYGGSIARDLAAAAAALRIERAASAGVVPIVAPLPLPDLPKFQVAWPEPRSLLAVPDGEGGLRDWYPAQPRLAGGPSP
jgi:hypothetical protein